MSKTVTLRLPESTYERFRTLAERENRPLSNFIETAASRYVEAEQFHLPSFCPKLFCLILRDSGLG